jgi:hypothetical protein
LEETGGIKRREKSGVYCAAVQVDIISTSPALCRSGVGATDRPTDLWCHVSARAYLSLVSSAAQRILDT